MTYTIENRMNYKGVDLITVKDSDGFYWTVEGRFVDNGRLTKAFNGITGFRKEDCIDSVHLAQASVDLDAWKKENPNATVEEECKALVAIWQNLPQYGDVEL